MQLSFAERLQILRKRTGLNQGAFGAKAFDLPMDSGRTKIKNIELGKQLPTPQEVELMARALGIPRASLEADAAGSDRGEGGGMQISAAVLDRFPNLGAYLEMLNKAVALNDEALITHIGETLAEILLNRAVPTMARAK